MADVHDKATRRKNMQAIGVKHTKPERLVRQLLKKAGIGYRLHLDNLPGKPDIVLTRHRICIFVQGCYWHGHHCHLFKVPGTRTGFWMNKIRGNVERDHRHFEQLNADGWRILSVWECALKGKTKLDDIALTERIEEFIFAWQDNGCISGGINERGLVKGFGTSYPKLNFSE